MSCYNNENNIINLINKVLAYSTNQEDLFVLLFQTRDIKKGKGERKLFYWMFIHLYLIEQFKEFMLQLLIILPQYGSFKDYNILWEMADERNILSLKKDIINSYIYFLNFDEYLYNTNQPIEKYSLAAKWAPRESGHFCDMARALARDYFYDSPISIKKKYTKYRKLISKINKQLGTTEINMTNNNWREINPISVPHRWLTIHNNAFKNKVHSGKNKGHIRYNKYDRIICAQQFEEYLKYKQNIILPNDINTSNKTNNINEIFINIIYDSRYNNIRNIYKKYFM